MDRVIEAVVWFTQSAGGTDDDRTSRSLWWHGTCGSDGVCWAGEDDIDDDDMVVDRR